MKKILISVFLSIQVINLYAQEKAGKNLQCESINEGLTVIKCDDGIFYQIEQKSFNSPLILSNTAVFDSRAYKNIEMSEPAPPSTYSSSTATSK